MMVRYPLISPRREKFLLFSSPPIVWGERERVRGYQTEIFLYHPSLSLFPLRDLVFLISILKSGSDIPYSLIYRQGCGTLFLSPQGERKRVEAYFLSKTLAFRRRLLTKGSPPEFDSCPNPVFGG
jgi:hypothetical protein